MSGTIKKYICHTHTMQADLLYGDKNTLLDDLLNKARQSIEIFRCPICGEEHDDEEDSMECCVAAAVELDEEGDLLSYTLNPTLENQIQEVEITWERCVAYWKPSPKASPKCYSLQEVQELVKKQGGYGWIEYFQGEHSVSKEWIQ